MSIRKYEEDLMYGQENAEQRYWEEHGPETGLAIILHAQDRLAEWTAYDDAPHVGGMIQLEEHSYDLLDAYFEDKFVDSATRTAKDAVLTYLVAEPDDSAEKRAFQRLNGIVELSGEDVGEYVLSSD